MKNITDYRIDAREALPIGVKDVLPDLEHLPEFEASMEVFLTAMACHMKIDKAIRLPEYAYVASEGNRQMEFFIDFCRSINPKLPHRTILKADQQNENPLTPYSLHAAGIAPAFLITLLGSMLLEWSKISHRGDGMEYLQMAFFVVITLCCSMLVQILRNNNDLTKEERQVLQTFFNEGKLREAGSLDVNKYQMVKAFYDLMKILNEKDRASKVYRNSGDEKLLEVAGVLERDCEDIKGRLRRLAHIIEAREVIADVEQAEIAGILLSERDAIKHVTDVAANDALLRDAVDEIDADCHGASRVVAQSENRARVHLAADDKSGDETINAELNQAAEETAEEVFSLARAQSSLQR